MIMPLRFAGKALLIALVFISFTASVFAKDDRNIGDEKCTNDDLRSIKSYNAMARKKIKDYNELVASSKDVVTDKDAKKFSKDMDRVTDFFDSDETKAMQDVYKRCSMTMPRPMAKQSFWIPKDKRIPHSAI